MCTRIVEQFSLWKIHDLGHAELEERERERERKKEGWKGAAGVRSFAGDKEARSNNNFFSFARFFCSLPKERVLQGSRLCHVFVRACVCVPRFPRHQNSMLVYFLSPPDSPLFLQRTRSLARAWFSFRNNSKYEYDLFSRYQQIYLQKNIKIFGFVWILFEEDREFWK